MFSIIVVPDVHFDYKITAENLASLINWIIENKETKKIQAVAFLGDISDVRGGSTQSTLFPVIRGFMDVLDSAGIPVLVSIGNHDYDNRLQTSRDSASFNNYLGLDMYDSKPWFGGSYDGKSENIFLKLNIEGRKIMLLSLEFGPRNKVLDWANNVILNHPDHDVMLFTHCYLAPGGRSTTTVRAYQGVSATPGPEYSNDGEEVWKKLVRHHPNIKVVFSGHFIADRMSHLVSKGVSGNVVHQFFQNWQNIGVDTSGNLTVQESGGRAQASFIRIFEFDLEANMASITNFVPPLNIEGEESVPTSFEYPVTPQSFEEIEKMLIKESEGLTEVDISIVLENGVLSEMTDVILIE